MSVASSNAMVALLATGGSTNHLIHWVAVARAAGILIDWDDFAAAVGRGAAAEPGVYPNGSADVNQFQAAGGPGSSSRELARRGLHARRRADGAQRGLARVHRHSQVADVRPALAVRRQPSGDESVVRPAVAAFQRQRRPASCSAATWGVAVIKVSAVPEDRHRDRSAVRACSDSQEALQAAFKAVSWTRDVVVCGALAGARRPMACPSCTSSRRRWRCCRARASGWRWSPMAA